MPISPLNCGFLLFDGFSNMVLASAVEPLRAARDIAGPGTFGWALATLDGAAATTSSGLSLAAAEPAVLRGADIVFAVAGYGARRHASRRVFAALKAIERRATRVGALDCGAWLLAGAGLLAGHRATIHWQELGEFREARADVEVVPDGFVVDRNRLTAGGAAGTLSLMLRLIAERGGATLAHDVANMFAHSPERGAAVSVPARRAENLVRAIAEMRRTQGEPLRLARIARVAAVSPRTLARLFAVELGISPGRYYRTIRLASARALAQETTLTAAEIAARTGFASASALSRALKGRYGRSVRRLRAPAPAGEA